MTIARKTTEVKFVRKIRFIAYPAGRYDSNTSYVCTEAAGPFVEQEGQYYAMYKQGTWLGSSIGRTPKEDYAQYGSDATWRLMDKYKALIVEMLFSDYAKLGSAIFLGDYMFSQYGVDTLGQLTQAYQNFDPAKLGDSNCPFTPKAYINWLTGKASFGDVEVNGVLNESCKVLDVNGTQFTAVNPDIRKYYFPLGSSGKVLNFDLDEINKTKVPINVRFYCMGASGTINFNSSGLNRLPIAYFINKKPSNVLSKIIKTVHMSQGTYLSVTFLNQNELSGYYFGGFIENFDHFEYESGSLELVIRSLIN